MIDLGRQPEKRGFRFMTTSGSSLLYQENMRLFFTGMQGSRRRCST